MGAFKHFTAVALLYCCNFLALVATNNNKTAIIENINATDSSLISVLPFVLKNSVSSNKPKEDKNQDVKAIEKAKLYTLLTATENLSPLSDPSNLDDSHNRKEIMEIGNLKGNDGEFSLLKPGMYDNWQRMHSYPHHRHHHNYGHHSQGYNGYNGMSDFLKNYYSLSVPIGALPVSLLLVLNLGVFLYVLLGVLFSIHRLLNVSIGLGYGGGTTPSSHSFQHNDFDHNQYGSYRRFSKD